MFFTSYSYTESVVVAAWCEQQIFVGSCAPGMADVSSLDVSSRIFRRWNLLDGTFTTRARDTEWEGGNFP